MRANNLLHILLLSGLILFAMTASASAELATLSSGPGGLSWQTLKSHEGLSLTVSGPEDVLVKTTFGANESASFSIFNEDGNVLPDGTYAWELRASAALERELAKIDRSLTMEVPGLEGQVMSGYFSIVDGQLIVPETGVVEAKAAPGADRDGVQTKDVVHLDDTIIDGSACVGQDCVNGENFGFDTLRLKENNLRLHFDDTSSSASFPSNDWRIIANDSGNGGANYLGIEDSTAGRIPFRVEAGAPVNTLYVEADGDVGIKTANPVVDVHVVEGNTPTLRLEQDGSDGFTPQTYDIAANESNFFIRDVTNGSKLFFRAKPGAPEDSIFIAADGDIGLGTASPAGQLHVRDAGTVLTYLDSSDGGAVQLRLRSSGDNRRLVSDNGSDAGVQTQLVLGDAGTFQFAGETVNSGVCLQFRDSDDAGDTNCTFLDGVMSCAAGACP